MSNCTPLLLLLVLVGHEDKYNGKQRRFAPFSCMKGCLIKTFKCALDKSVEHFKFNIRKSIVLKQEVVQHLLRTSCEHPKISIKDVATHFASRKWFSPLVGA
jgi:hypothetical protein